MELCHEIGVLIDTWCEADPENQTPAVLAERSGVDYGLVLRTASREASPSLHICLKLLNVLTDRQTAAEFIERHFPDGISHSGAGCHGTLNQEIAGFLQDRIGFRILNRASALAGDGITREEISSRFGQDGLELTERMLNLGILRGINGRLRCDSIDVNDADLVLDIIRRQAGRLNPARFGNGTSVAGYRTAFWSEQGLRLATGEVKKLFKSLTRLQEDPQNRGERMGTLGAFLSHDEDDA